MQNILWAHRAIVPTLLGLSIFIGIFIFRPIYQNYMDISLTHTREQKNSEEKQKLLSELQALKTSFEASWSTNDRNEKIQRLSTKWNASGFMSAITINDYTRATELTQAPIKIGSISVWKWTKGMNGLSLGTISFSVGARSIDDMVEFITYLTQKSPYVFTIDSISLPIDTSISTDSAPIALNLTLGVYYFEP